MSEKHDSPVQEDFNKLRDFRQAVYGQFGNGKDALFELSDAVLQMRTIQSFVELSCAPAFRRKWSSAYEALQDGQPQRNELLKVYLRLLPPTERLLLAVDHTAWPRLWAETLPERSYQHQPSAIPSHSPVTIGQGYSTVVGVPEATGSWALPLLHEQFSDQKPIQQGAAQLKQICGLLGGVRPLILADSEYGGAEFLLATRAVPADKLLRLRANTALEGATRPYLGHGPKPIHGIPFRCNDPTTWGPPESTYHGTSERYGPFTVRVWSGLRFAKALDLPLSIACRENPQAPDTRRLPKLTWFGWQGGPPPEQWWHYYNRRYPVDHWYRFAKGRLHWLLPKVTTLQQSQCWSDLMPLLTWELWLARPLVSDKPLPWQKPQGNLTPGRVCQGMPALLPLLGTPTRVCKPRGKAPGWPTGRARTHRKRFELRRSKRWQAIRAKKKAQAPASPPKRGRPKQNPPLPPA